MSTIATPHHRSITNVTRGPEGRQPCYLLAMQVRTLTLTAAALTAALTLAGIGLAEAAPAQPPRLGGPCTADQPPSPRFDCVNGTWAAKTSSSKKPTPTKKPARKPSATSTATPSVPSTTASAPGWTSAPSNTLFTRGSLTIGTSLSTSAPAVGSVFACQLLRGDAAAGGNRQPWIHGAAWNPAEKLKVSGANAWPGTISITTRGAQRVLAGNGLPVTSKTGTFPIAMRDPARRYDGNPNAISANAFTVTVPAQPQVAAAPSCMRGGPIGYTTNGVAIFNALDAANRDAAVYEVLDQCWGHPERDGRYHFHTISSCTDAGSATQNSPVWGFMRDGFPITGPWENGVQLTTKDLDICHGKTSEITLDGRKVTTYHYVATEEYPYTASCYRGTPQ